MTIAGVERRDDAALVTIASQNGAHKLSVKAGVLPCKTAAAADDQFVHTAFHDQLLTDLALTHLATDFCIIGPRVRQPRLIHPHVALHSVSHSVSHSVRHGIVSVMVFGMASFCKCCVFAGLWQEFNCQEVCRFVRLQHRDDNALPGTKSCFTIDEPAH